MARNKSDIFLHFVWATWNRLDLLTGEERSAAYGTIRSECKNLGCNVLALGGMPDHVHLAVEIPTTKSISRIMQQVKGVSSTVARNVASPDYFGWQDGYGVFSFSRSQIAAVQKYIDNQVTHHSQGLLWPEVEEFGTDQDRISFLEPANCPILSPGRAFDGEAIA